MRLSHKDFLLLIGILVAAIIAFTTLVYRDPSGDKKQSIQKTSTNPPTSMIIDKIFRETNLKFKI